MTKSIKNQFFGFLATPSLWLKNDIFDYPLFHTNPDIPNISSEEIPQPQNYVLGKRIEEFFRFYIENFSEEEVLACNEQIINEKITVGELDFLLKNLKTSQVSHVELVYKFYLYDPSHSKIEIERWVGPNKRDFLLKKLDHLKQHQFPLLEHPATAKLLKEFKIPATEVEQKLCFKANLFLPVNHKQIPPVVNPEAIQGFWMRPTDFSEEHFSQSSFFTPKKEDWPVFPGRNEKWISFQEFLPVINQLLKRQQSPLVWMKNKNGSCERFFIVWW